MIGLNTSLLIESDKGGDVVQVMSLFHDDQVVFRFNFEYLLHLVQHLPMQPGHAHRRTELPWMLLEFFHQGEILMGLGRVPKTMRIFFIILNMITKATT